MFVSTPPPSSATRTKKESPANAIAHICCCAQWEPMTRIESMVCRTTVQPIEFHYANWEELNYNSSRYSYMNIQTLFSVQWHVTYDNGVFSSGFQSLWCAEMENKIYKKIQNRMTESAGWKWILCAKAIVWWTSHRMACESYRFISWFVQINHLKRSLCGFCVWVYRAAALEAATAAASAKYLTAGLIWLFGS